MEEKNRIKFPKVGKQISYKYKPISENMGEIKSRLALKTKKSSSQNILLQTFMGEETYQSNNDLIKERQLFQSLYQDSTRQKNQSRWEKQNNLRVGKGAIKSFYKDYRELGRRMQKESFNKKDVSKYTSMSMLLRAEELQVLPCKLDLIKQKGQASSLNLTYYNLGSKYIQALSSGLVPNNNITKYLLSKNRIADHHIIDLLANISKDLTYFDVSFNQLTHLSPKFIEILNPTQSKLQYLNIEGNKMKHEYLGRMCKTIELHQHLQSLNLRNNGLGNNSSAYIRRIIQNNYTLEELYIGQNNFTSTSGLQIFKALAANKNIRILDFHLCKIGEDLPCLQSIIQCILLNTTIQHLDLSYDNFTKEESIQISKALNQNHTIYGFHFIGNHGYVNSQQFLIIDQNREKEKTQWQEIVHHKINSFQIATRRQHFMISSETQHKHVCWICEGWNEVEFEVDTQQLTANSSINDNEFKGRTIQMLIHFSFEMYQPRKIIVQLTEPHEELKSVQYKAMVPPQKFYYYFTIEGIVYLDKTSKTVSEDDLIEINRVMKHYGRGSKQIIQKCNERSCLSKSLYNNEKIRMVETIPRESQTNIKCANFTKILID